MTRENLAEAIVVVNKKHFYMFVLLTVYSIDIYEFFLLTSPREMERDIFYVEFGKLVRGHRQRLGLTQDQLGERVGLSRTSITNIEQGRQKVLLHQVVILAESLEISPEALLPAVPALEVTPQIEQKLPTHLTGAERDWVRRIMATDVKRGVRHADTEN